MDSNYKKMMMQTKSKPIKHKIFLPLIILLMIAPIISLILFNVVFTQYLRSNIEDELMKTLNIAQSKINETLREIDYVTDDFQAGNNIDTIRDILYNHRSTTNVEMIFFDGNKNYYQIQFADISFITSDLVEKAKDNLETINVLSPTTVDTNDGKYAITGYQLSGLYFAQRPYVVFVSSYDIYGEVIWAVNTSLIAFMILGILVSLVASSAMAKRVESNINELNKATKYIGRREIYFPKDDSDIIEINQLTKNIVDMAKKIINYDKAQKAFLQNASHELKNPLMAIQGYGEGLEKGIFEDTKEAGQVINQESKRLNSLLNQLLTLSRIENLNYAEKIETMDLNKIVLEYARVLKGRAIKEKKQINVSYSENPIIVEINDELMYQCIINVTSNAIRYAKENIFINIEQKDNFALIKIQDDGLGFTLKDYDRIFDRFYKGEGGNFGLGLTIAKEAITQIGGTISASNNDVGALVTITIPMKV